ncbi:MULTISPECIES: RNase adapter RapZ [Aliivibrio]|uniref:GlmZ(SRNA)-inactivating NTPase n=1 Tax=Aliivibrio fischeri SR5 TaxID=1088719 RepID=A0AAV3EWA7_ALIFS|nr:MULTISPECIES: RNase adapter RapZ [Aliivibrio]EHN71194.1 glmZ(sRNA)-inactivating NTPase [Aliivibrio fischeri SR5]MBD1569255.1 RNase adapter RapZ [Aliivibrio sp. S10_S31]MUJ24858.1 RNase adapter RapZ [Aliivibrio fischeri]MUK26316.1 RNase adapter RapZ [Aliivibrio fischeri]MUK32465.1 RNase adapter RapZ [Aliivibrio fischeri]
MKLMVVSGSSGAGKSVALRVLEDLGYYCVDNLPIDLLTQFVESIQHSSQNVAVSVDIRNLPKDPALLKNTLALLKKTHDVTVIFLDAEDKELIKRYSETRRLHPLSLIGEQCSLEQAVTLEKSILSDYREEADLVLDTTTKSIHDLSETLRSRILGRESKELVMVFESFGFKHGLPTDADYVFDVRFLPNPHWEPSLRPMTGLDKPVADYLAKHAEVIQLKEQIQQFLTTWLPALEKNNRSYLTVAIGCTGGQHRSVYITQQLGEYFKQRGKQVQIRHKTLERH